MDRVQMKHAEANRKMLIKVKLSKSICVRYITFILAAFL